MAKADVFLQMGQKIRNYGQVANFKQQKVRKINFQATESKLDIERNKLK